jgi:hypothetical protein
MKAQCPTKCGRELGGESYVLCPICYAEVPQHMKDAITRAALIVRKARKPMAVSAAFRNQRLVRERAVQFVVDKQNKEKVSA